MSDDEQGGKEEPYELEEGQESVARLVHMVSHSSSHDIHYDLLMKFKKVFVKGGPKRMKYTVPAMVMALIRLSQDIYYNYFSSFTAQVEEAKDNDEEPLVHKVTYKKIFTEISALI